MRRGVGARPHHRFRRRSVARRRRFHRLHGLRLRHDHERAAGHVRSRGHGRAEEVARRRDRDAPQESPRGSHRGPGARSRPARDPQGERGRKGARGRAAGDRRRCAQAQRDRQTLMKKPALALLIVAAMLGGLVAIVGGIGALLYLGANGLWSRKPTEAERKLIVTSNALADYVKLDASCETLKSKRNIDGTREIEAEYEPEQCRAAEQVSFVSGAEIARTKRDARESFAL